MNKKLSLLFLFFIGFSMLVSAQSILNMNLVYDNNGLTPITNTQVLLKLNGITVASATTNASGYCFFNNLQAGTYQCIPVCTKPWGGVTLSDVFFINIHFIHYSTGGILTGLKLIAADVNGLGGGTNLDILLITKRLKGLIPNFMPPVAIPGQPDWIYETIDILVPASGTVTQQIKMICTGDVNGSYIP